MEHVLVTRGLTRRFGEFTAVDSLDLAVPKGSFYGFLGPNGAGKSTTMKCLTGLLDPSEGEMEILGIDPRQDPIGLKRRIGVVPEGLALLDRLTGAENLSFVGRSWQLDHTETRRRGERLLEVLDLEGAAGTLALDYSTGMRKKLALAMALLPGPELLFLDEPFEGIDAIAARSIKQLLSRFVERGGTIFLTSHILEVVENLADHVGVIAGGQLVVEAPLAELRGTTGESLEDIFLHAVGAKDLEASTLDWLEG